MFSGMTDVKSPSARGNSPLESIASKGEKLPEATKLSNAIGEPPPSKDGSPSKTKASPPATGASGKSADDKRTAARNEGKSPPPPPTVCSTCTPEEEDVTEVKPDYFGAGAAEGTGVEAGGFDANENAWFQLFVSKPWVQFALLSVVVAVHFAPLWPRLSAFIQGCLVAVFVILIVVMFKLSSLLKPKKVVEADVEETKKSSDHGSKQAKKKGLVDENTFMNILLYEEGPYSLDNFDMSKTRTVYVHLKGTRVELHFPKECLPYRKYHEEKTIDKNDLEYFPQPLVYELDHASIQMLPMDLPRTKRVSKSFPIAMRFEATSPEGKARTIYLFPRTSREKEYWFKKIYEMIHYARGNTQTFTTTAGRYQAYTSRIYLERMQCTHLTDRMAYFMNTVMARVWYNLRESKSFEEYCIGKLTHNLRRTKIAKLFRHVGITELKVGQYLPTVTQTYIPFEDSQGMWFDFDIYYDADFEVMIKAQGIKYPSKKLSRMSTKKSSKAERSEWLDEGRRSVLKTSKLAQSSLWQNIFSNWWTEKSPSKPILVKIQVKKVKGQVTFNMPTPPADRIWYGFRKPPLIDMVVLPSYGNVALSYGSTDEEKPSPLEIGIVYPLVSFVENIIKEQVMKTAVLPNLRDQILPLFHSPDWARKKRWFT